MLVSSKFFKWFFFFFFFWVVVVVPTSPSGWFHDGSVGGIGVCYLSLQMILHRLGALGSFTSSPFLFFSYRPLAIFLPPPVFQVLLEGRKKKMEGGGGSSSFSLLSPLNRA